MELLAEENFERLHHRYENATAAFDLLEPRGEGYVSKCFCCVVTISAI
jgi:hypothetical protein